MEQKMNTSKHEYPKILSRRAATMAIACAGVQTLSSPALAQGRAVPIISFEELVGSAQTIVIAKLNRFSYSEIDTIDDYKPLAEVREPIRAAVDISILRVIANSTEVIKHPPIPQIGSTILHTGMRADMRSLQECCISQFIGCEAILLLGHRRSFSSSGLVQIPIYPTKYGTSSPEEPPYPLSRLKDVLAIALSAGLVQPL
jgi:hypothetical protein